MYREPTFNSNKVSSMVIKMYCEPNFASIFQHSVLVCFHMLLAFLSYQDHI